MLYKCLNCNTHSYNYYYIKKHSIKKNHNINSFCSFCNTLYTKNHYSICPNITKLLLLTIL
jgi:hypothetical protein